MNDGDHQTTFNEGHMKVEGETAYCVDINTSSRMDIKQGLISTRMSSDQIADVALSLLEYVKQYTATHTGLNNNHRSIC